MADKKRIPERFEKNAPRFDDEKPEELPQFLEDMERMMDIEKTEAAEKNEFLVRYAFQKPAEQWRKFKSYKKTYEEFKKEVLENYPTAQAHKRGSLRKLLKIMKGYDDADLTMDDADEVMKLIREMNVEVDKLMVDPPQITDREAVTMFLEKLDPSFRNLDMLETIKQTVVNMVDRLETGQKAQRAELEQFYKTLPGRIAGAPDSQTLPPRREIRMRPVTASDLCHYCAEAGTHFISNCPHRRRHIEGGDLKVINGQDCLPNGDPIRTYGNKSRRQIVDEFKAKGVQVNYQQAPVSYPAGIYNLSIEERVAIEQDDGTGYGYLDPTEYDPRDDEILTLRRERATLQKQLIQHQRMQSGGVQPPPVASNSDPTISQFLASYAKMQPFLTAPDSQFAAITRSASQGNPSRTGNSNTDTNEGF
ncbi:hypothetical protein DFH07DRAFT_916456 [Mycena maculata]|uniref:Uncharacterized protein n=1 Tax=Mycena maculata TaxID=230809 RepID=A0AAD7JK42_9AGAR|nr:hypothetical protein DFH07DRAFT_916456 [Mycena maculata]